ncbi:MAG: hypothetical protein MZU91_01025 [Desulfosudis oleivorans]|nr:hypothetical protein [Desulfosudis oleivorans]
MDDRFVIQVDGNTKIADHQRLHFRGLGNRDGDKSQVIPAQDACRLAGCRRECSRRQRQRSG